MRKRGLGVVLDSDLPHLIGIDDDILSTGIMLFHIKVSVCVCVCVCGGLGVGWVFVFVDAPVIICMCLLVYIAHELTLLKLMTSQVLDWK